MAEEVYPRNLICHRMGPVSYTHLDGLDTNSSSLKQELKDYQSLQYYQLFDWKKE